MTDHPISDAELDRLDAAMAALEAKLAVAEGVVDAARALMLAVGECELECSADKPYYHLRDTFTAYDAVKP